MVAQDPADARATIVVLVDGTCVFCNRLVSFLLKRDRQRIFRYAQIQGETATAVFARHDLVADVDTIYAVTDFGGPQERVWADGEAGRRIWPRTYRLAAILRVVPLVLLNLQYRLFARVRYRLFGQADACIMPSAEERQYFLP